MSRWIFSLQASFVSHIMMYSKLNLSHKNYFTDEEMETQKSKYPVLVVLFYNPRLPSSSLIYSLSLSSAVRGWTLHSIYESLWALSSAVCPGTKAVRRPLEFTVGDRHYHINNWNTVWKGFHRTRCYRKMGEYVPVGERNSNKVTQMWCDTVATRQMWQFKVNIVKMN